MTSTPEGPAEAERQAADELARLGQEMRLDEPVQEWLAGAVDPGPGPVDDPEQIAERIRELRAAIDDCEVEDEGMPEFNSLRSTSRLLCLVDGCDWHHDDPGPVPGPVEEWPTMMATGLDDYISQIMKSHYQGLDNIVRAHLYTHHPEDYARTIARLNNRVAELEARLPEVESYEDKLRAAQELAREMEAEDGPVTEAELEELRKVWPRDV